MFRFRPSVESLETRETPASLASVTDLVIDSYNPRFSGESATIQLAAPTDSSADKPEPPPPPPPPPSTPLPVLLVIANRDFYYSTVEPSKENLTDTEATKPLLPTEQLYGGYNFPPQGGSIPTGTVVFTIGGPQVEPASAPQPTILLQRLANPGAAPDDTNDQAKPTTNYSAIVFVGGWGSSGI